MVRLNATTPSPNKGLVVLSGARHAHPRLRRSRIRSRNLPQRLGARATEVWRSQSKRPGAGHSVEVETACGPPVRDPAKKGPQTDRQAQAGIIPSVWLRLSRACRVGAEGDAGISFPLRSDARTGPLPARWHLRARLAPPFPRCGRREACPMCRSKGRSAPRCCCRQCAWLAWPYPGRSSANPPATLSPWGHGCRHRVRCADRCSR